MKFIWNKPSLAIAFLVTFALNAAFAQLTVTSLLSDHAVVQRCNSIHVWGVALPHEQVDATFHEQSAKTNADEYGYWSMWLAPEQAGGPYVLTVSSEKSKQKITRTDILVGDVWFASGQSNMVFPMTGFGNAPLKNGAQELAQATHPSIRLFLQKRRVSDVVLHDTDDEWKICDPESAKTFSAVAYFFGRDLSAAENVPIGLIDASWGGTPAHSWISLTGIAVANLPSIAADAGDIAEQQGRVAEIRSLYSTRKGKERDLLPDPKHIGVDSRGAWIPGSLFNGMIAPFTQYPIKGVIWYQGETNTFPQRASDYQRVLSALILDWRRQWNQGPFPFLIVQISSYGSGAAPTRNNEWGEVRDAQRRVTDETAHTALAMTLDIGSITTVHPPDKQEVGRRLALLARKHVYGENIAADSPTFLRARPENSVMHVWFDHAQGLHLSQTGISDFEVAGENHRFFPATARVDGETILVRSDSVPRPMYVRYGWKAVASESILNSADLPASTFTSEY